MFLIFIKIISKAENEILQNTSTMGEKKKDTVLCLLQIVKQ